MANRRKPQSDGFELQPEGRWDWNTLTPAQRQAWDLLAEAAERNLYIFAKYFLDRERLVERVHRPLCDAITSSLRNTWHWPAYGDADSAGADWTGEGDAYRRETLIRIDSRNSLYLLPRGTYKSTLLSEALPLWILINRPDYSIALITYKDADAQKRINTIREFADSNPKLIHYWTGENAAMMRDRTNYNGKAWWDSLTWRSGALTIGARTQTRSDPSVTGIGIKALHAGAHFEVVIFDDIIEKETAQSETEQRLISEKFTAVGPMLTEPKIRIVVGTPWLKYDQYQLLLDRKIDGGRPLWDRYIRSVQNPDGSWWLPEVIDESEMERIKAENVREPWIVQGQYYMNPVSTADQSLEADKIHWFYTGDKVTERPMRVLVTVDPADQRGLGKGAWGIATMGGDSDRNIYDLDCEKGPMDAGKATDIVIKMCRKFNADGIVIENTVISRNYIDATLKPALMEAGLSRVAVHEVSHGGQSKQTRIMNVENGLGAVMAAGRLWLRADNLAVRSELNNFPDTGPTYDVLDAMAYAVLTFQQLRFWPRADEVVASDVKLTPEMERYNRKCDKAIKERVAKETGRGRWAMVRPGIFRSVSV